MLTSKFNSNRFRTVSKLKTVEFFNEWPTMQRVHARCVCLGVLITELTARPLQSGLQLGTTSTADVVPHSWHRVAVFTAPCKLNSIEGETRIRHNYMILQFPQIECRSNSLTHCAQCHPGAGRFQQNISSVTPSP